MNITKKSFYLFFILLILAVSIRVCLFYTYWGSERHGSAVEYGSAAIGLFYGEELTINKSEQKKIGNIATNYTGNYLSFHDVENRKTFTEFLPGPSILLYSLWKVLPIYNFSPYIWLQIILESFLISIFYFTFRHIDKTIVLTATILMAINPVAIKYTLTMGYDFWPHFCVLVNFIGIAIVLKKQKPGFILFLTGILTGIPIWSRSITSILPFYIFIFLLFYWRLKDKMNYRKISINATLYLLAVIISMASLSAYRYEQTGSYRPTRSTFWHSFWAGVVQFSNPYGLECKDKVNDTVVWEFGQKLNGELKKYSLGEMYVNPNSPYEQTLKAEAFRFLSEHPHLFIRNFLHRIAIMISPVLYKDGGMIPKSLAPYYVLPIGIALLIIWSLGMCNLFRHSRPVFWLTVTIYSYFFSTIGCFYVVGRAILPFLFINIFVYLFGLQFSIRLIKRWKVHAIGANP
jgi:4-amino-4-deoxy-L-arabinose transferase-like glycosyltransferase